MLERLKQFPGFRAQGRQQLQVCELSTCKTLKALFFELDSSSEPGIAHDCAGREMPATHIIVFVKNRAPLCNVEDFDGESATDCRSQICCRPNEGLLGLDGCYKMSTAEFFRAIHSAPLTGLVKLQKFNSVLQRCNCSGFKLLTFITLG